MKAVFGSEIGKHERLSMLGEKLFSFGKPNSLAVPPEPHGRRDNDNNMELLGHVFLIVAKCFIFDKQLRMVLIQIN